MIETPFYRFVEGAWYSSPLEAVLLNLLAAVVLVLYAISVFQGRDKNMVKTIDAAADCAGLAFIILGFFVYQGVWHWFFGILPAGPEWLMSATAAVMLIALLSFEVILCRLVVRRILLKGDAFRASR